MPLFRHALTLIFFLVPLFRHDLIQAIMSSAPAAKYQQSTRQQSPETMFFAIIDNGTHFSQNLIPVILIQTGHVNKCYTLCKTQVALGHFRVSVSNTRYSNNGTQFLK